MNIIANHSFCLRHIFYSTDADKSSAQFCSIAKVKVVMEVFAIQICTIFKLEL